MKGFDYSILVFLMGVMYGAETALLIMLTHPHFFAENQTFLGISLGFIFGVAFNELFAEKGMRWSDIANRIYYKLIK